MDYRGYRSPGETLSCIIACFSIFKVENDANCDFFSPRRVDDRLADSVSMEMRDISKYYQSFKKNNQVNMANISLVSVIPMTTFRRARANLSIAKRLT